MNHKTHLLLRLILAALCVPVFGFWPVLTLLAVYEVLAVILWLRDGEDRSRSNRPSHLQLR